LYPLPPLPKLTLSSQQKILESRILAMGGGDLAKIIQDMTFKRFNKYPRYKSSWGRFIPGVKPTSGKVKIL
jgi:hypothetical protein